MLNRELVVAGFILLTVAPAHAAEPAAPPPPDWSMAAGLTLYQGYYYTVLNGNVVTATPAYPSGSLQLERRISGSTWLLANFSVSGGTNGTQYHGTQPGQSTPGDDSTSNSSESFSIGLRHVLWEKWRVSLSGYVTANVNGTQNGEVATTQQQYETNNTITGEPETLHFQQILKTTSYGWGVGLQCGLTLDVALTYNLGIRIGTGVGSLNYSRYFQQSHTTYTGSLPPEATPYGTSSDEGGFSAGLMFSPTLLLRIVF